MRRGAAPAVAPEPAQRHVEVRDDLEGERRPKAAGDPAHSALAAPGQGCKSGVSTSHVRAQSRSRAREQLGDGNLGAPLPTGSRCPPPPAEPGSTLPAPQALLSAPKGLILPSGCVCGGGRFGAWLIFMACIRGKQRAACKHSSPQLVWGFSPCTSKPRRAACIWVLRGDAKIRGCMRGRR